MKKRIEWMALFTCIALVFLVALAGSFFTSQNSGSQWYNSIKPSITPPNFVFPIVWNILFLLIALSLYFAWTSIKKNKTKKSKSSRDSIALFFGINLFLNLLWSFLFFAMKLPAFAFFELIILWISILALIFVTYKIRKLSAYLLIPYALWIAFAGVLNYLIAFA